MSVKVSILVPTYNRAGYLRAAIRSALAQTHSDIEVIVLDDASPDETPAVVREFSPDPRFRCIRHPQNVGIAQNWRRGIEAASGDYFCLLHDDDTFEPEFVACLLQPLEEHKNLILACCDHWAMNPDGQRLQQESDEMSKRFKRHALPEGKLADFGRSAIVDGSTAIGATLFRKSMVSPDFIDERAKGSIDAWLFYQCVKTGFDGYYVARRLMNYRVHGGGMSQAMPLYMEEGHLFRYRSILADPERASLHAVIRRLLAESAVNYGVGLLAAGRNKEARRSLRESFRWHKSYRAFVAYALACSGTAGAKITGMLRKLRQVSRSGLLLLRQKHNRG